MKLVGTIIVHSILQEGPGVPIFSPGIYYCLVKGNVEEALKGLTVTDCSLPMKHVIEKVMNMKFICMTKLYNSLEGGTFKTFSFPDHVFSHFPGSLY